MDNISNKYRRGGVEAFYREHADDYRNPHEFVIEPLLRLAYDKCCIPLDTALDLACGSGEVTLALKNIGVASIDGLDPYTSTAYQKRTGKTALALSFEDVAKGKLRGEEEVAHGYDVIVCSFALHLAEESWLPMLCRELSVLASRLIIITPHKKPVLKEEWGYTLMMEEIKSKVRVRVYSA